MEGVFFDLGLTLIYPSIAEDSIRLLEELGSSIPFSSMEEAVYKTDQHFFKHYPGVLNQPVEYFFPWYAEVLMKHLNIEVFVPTFAKGMLNKYPPRSRWILYPDTIPALKKLSDEGCHLGLITNWDLSARRVVEEVGIMPYFHTIVVSAEEGIEKPDEKIFSLAIERSGLNPSKLLYIGDNYRDDVEGARGAGIEGVLINRYSKYCKGNHQYDCQEIVDLNQAIELLQKE